jgi:class 3 adenylate cyclase
VTTVTSADPPIQGLSGRDRAATRRSVEASKSSVPTGQVLSRGALTTAWILAFALPVVGLVSLLLRSQLDPQWSNPRLHVVLFLGVGGGAFVLAYLAGQAADRRGDARVFLLSLAFLVTGGFLAVHAVGTPGVLLNNDLPGFQVAIPVGLLVAALFAGASAFVDVRPGFAPAVVRHKDRLRAAVFGAVSLWIIWTLAQVPPLGGSSVEGAGMLLKTLAGVGAAVYALSALRYLAMFRRDVTLLPASVIACFLLLAEAMFGSALVGERTWHASWWEWHGLIVTAYVVIFFAAHHQWQEERFHSLYLATTRERSQELSVLFADLAGFTTFSEQAQPAEVATMLSTYYGLATPLIARRFGGEVEKFMGDAIMATFNRRGDQPDHAVRAARAGLELQRQMALVAAEHPGWPSLRVGINTGQAQVQEMGGRGYVVYAVVGDTINVGSRLEGQAPLGGVLIGAETYRRLPPEADAEARPGLSMKGKNIPVDAYVLHSVPISRTNDVHAPSRS